LNQFIIGREESERGFHLCVYNHEKESEKKYMNTNDVYNRYIEQIS
jgi:ATP-dependent protease Clp ATPase subunit